MNASILTRGIALATVAGCLATGPIEAQGGFLRRAQQQAEERIGSVGSEPHTPETASSAPGVSAPPGPEAVNPALLAMDDAVLDRFTRALEAELGSRDEWTSYEQEFRQCHEGMSMNDAVREEMVSLTERMSSEMEGATTTEDMIAVGERYQASMDSLARKHCGATQTEVGERRGEVDDRALEAAFSAGTLDDRQYALLKERVVPFCTSGGGSGTVPGPRGDKFYVYSPEEIAALGPRCEAILPLLERAI